MFKRQVASHWLLLAAAYVSQNPVLARDRHFSEYDLSGLSLGVRRREGSR
jgi:hypothetical protein